MNTLNRKPLTLNDMNALLPGTLPGHMGIVISAIRERELDARMAVEPHHLAPNGYLHAASVVALADTACGLATYLNLADGASGFTTIELKSNHLGTARKGHIECTATAQHIGRSTHVWDAAVTDQDTGRTITIFRCTQMVLWPS